MRVSKRQVIYKKHNTFKRRETNYVKNHILNQILFYSLEIQDTVKHLEDIIGFIIMLWLLASISTKEKDALQCDSQIIALKNLSSII